MLLSTIQYHRSVNSLMELHRRLLRMLLGLLSLSLAGPAFAEDVTIVRDRWGIPHVKADTDTGAMYGLGYATAEDRGVQMTLSLRLIQGRAAEVLGNVKKVSRNETTIDHDRKMRTFGYYRAAQRIAGELDAETLELLDAYCAGINAAFAELDAEGQAMFDRLELEREPWTRADCLACWWHMAQFFATDGTRDVIAGRNAGNGPGRRAAGRGAGRGARPSDTSALVPLPPDDAAAVVKRTDLKSEWLDEIWAYARQRGLITDRQNEDAGREEAPKFSHAWVVGGGRSTTGAATLVSDPQTPVRNPAMFYEYHVQGATFNGRGIGVPGCPMILIGFNEHVAWGVTALGADQADLFQVHMDPDHPGQYRFDGEWRMLEERRETIQVKGGKPIEHLVRESHLGPIATEFCFVADGEPEVALKRIPVCVERSDTLQAMLAMWRAKSTIEFDSALAAWQFPSANMIFGDRTGSIGYRVVGALPIRSAQDGSQGRMARPGHVSAQDWQEMMPHHLKPGVIDPACGFLFSGNHRPIESWYPLPLGISTGAGGDTLRSWRLRERLEAKDSFSPEDVLAIHFDSVNPARRDLVRLGLHLRDTQHHPLSKSAALALEHLEPWWHAGASTSLSAPGAALALELNTFFRFVNTELAIVYGGGEGGLSYFLKTATQRLNMDPNSQLSNLEIEYIERNLEEAWEIACEKYGPDVGTWADQAQQEVRSRQLGHYQSLDGFPELTRDGAVAMPGLTRIDGGTLGCQTAQSYTQWVPLHQPDMAMSLLPIGNSERLGASTRTSTIEDWEHSRLHPAPLSWDQVQSIKVSSKIVLKP
jgi:penicillin amidase